MKKNIEQAIIEQIQKEEHSSRLYLQMAIWCEINGFLERQPFYTNIPTKNVFIS